MFSNITLILALVGSASGILGYLRRHRNPQLSSFLMSFMFICWGIWLLASTYDLAMQGQARRISRFTGLFSKEGNERMYTFSVWFHSIIGAIGLIMGCLGAILAFKKDTPFSR
ncbi:MAG: hypothetical protein R2880_04650 [Deinococcales bacterium]